MKQENNRRDFLIKTGVLATGITLGANSLFASELKTQE
jgi:hypothetical protein